MADDTSEIQLIGDTREHSRRTSLIDNARLGADYASQQQNAGGDINETAGFWNGEEFVSYFQFGISKFGDGSVLK